MKKGRELQERWSISDFDFLGCVTRYGLQPYDPFDEPIPIESIQIRIAELLDRRDEFVSLYPDLTPQEMLGLDLDQLTALKYMADKRKVFEDKWSKNLNAVIQEVLDYFYKNEDAIRFERKYPRLGGTKSQEAATPSSFESSEPSGSRKRDYRSEQWENAIPIAEKLFEENNLITLEEIRSDPDFKACFPSYMPSDDRIRDILNKACIKLAAGVRRKHPRSN